MSNDKDNPVSNETGEYLQPEPIKSEPEPEQKALVEEEKPAPRTGKRSR